MGLLKLRHILAYFYYFSSLSFANTLLKQPEINGANTALIYLSRFGHMDPSISNDGEIGQLMGKEKVEEALKNFQAFAGLNQTGLLDEETLYVMRLPRCGVADKVGYGSNTRRKKRYALQGSRWKVNDLTYKITKYPSARQITAAEVDDDVRRAFKVWEDYTELTFRETNSGKIHIEIRFEHGEHGDGDPFDGKGGTLAHAYFPIYGGDAHFDAGEKWTVKGYYGTNLFQTAAHEFGHSLGLSHSDVQSALMAPFYRGYQSRFKLDDDDIRAIQSLYGKKKTKDKNTTEKPPTYDISLCKGEPIDTIATIKGDTYIFRGSYFWKLREDAGIVEGYPKKFSTIIPGLPPNLDAAFTWTNGKTYFFKGSKYWRTTGFNIDDDYPKYISKGFTGIPSNVDAAFVWSGNGKIYFFKGEVYYKFDPEQKPPVSSRYPKDIKIWDLPYDIDAATQYTNGYTYFFKNGKYWRFNDRRFEIDKADPPFPRNSKTWWFGCPKTNSNLKVFENSTTNQLIPTSEEYDEYYQNDDYSLHKFLKKNGTKNLEENDIKKDKIHTKENSDVKKNGNNISYSHGKTEFRTENTSASSCQIILVSYLISLISLYII